MRTPKKTVASGALLDLWRPPQGAGDPIGCLATTYTFAPALFEEQSLARFLEIESEPNRENLAFLLERASRLGSVYAGVLVDHTQAGVAHSLRWDVLPVRIGAGKQHAKLSLLAWSHHIRIIVASANLTEPGYRTNHEVAGAVDLTPEGANSEVAAEAWAFLRSLLLLVPGASQSLPEIRRAEAFLDQVERQLAAWPPLRRGGTVRQRLLFTLPTGGAGRPASSSLEDGVEECRRRGGSPTHARVASPFFDGEKGTNRAAAALCKLMARGGQREIVFCVPAIRDEAATTPRLAAPIGLLRTPPAYQGTVTVEMLPELDGDKNRRPWHAKMLALQAEQYSALMIGSSNFTCAGMGVGLHRNAEANLLTIVERLEYGREAGQLEALWPEMELVADPEAAEWLGAQPEKEEEEQAKQPPLPAGFLAATYRAGDNRLIVLRFDPGHVPEGDWRVLACGQEKRELLSATTWREGGAPSAIDLPWAPLQPPEKLLVCWAGHEAFLALNVEDSRHLPPPAVLDGMSAVDMLGILAASDPSAAFRTWAAGQQPPELFDGELDSATPPDLDPLRRYDLNATFLHKIRRRARVLAQLRSNLQRPVWSRQALDWRLHGLIGVEALACRFRRDCSIVGGGSDEALLTLADFLIVLREVDYQPSDGSLPKAEFEKVFRPFLRDLAERTGFQIVADRDGMADDTRHFWERVVGRCQE